MHEEFPFLSLLLITGLAAFVPLLASRLRKVRLPIVVGEILVGMVIGKSGLNLVETGPALEFLTTFGFTYLMFISGLEVDFGVIASGSDKNGNRRWLDNPVNMGLTVFAVTLVMALLAAVGLEQLGLIRQPFMIALILSTTSLGIVVPVLKERNLTATRYGQTLLMAALVADFGTLFLITIQVAIISKGFTLEILLVLLLFVAFAIAVRVGKLVAAIPGLPRIMDELSHATAQVQVRGALALMVAFIALSDWLGTEVILGAFMAGAVISLLSRPDGSQLRLKMDAIGFGFFIPIFFITVGVQFDLPVLLNSSQALLLVPLLLVIAYLIKFGAGLLFRFGFSWRETFAGGALLSARLSLIIAAAAIALDLGIISDTVNAAIILVAIVTCTASPLIFNRLLPPRSVTARQGVIVVGLGEMPILLAERLHRAGEQVTIVGRDRGRMRQLQRQDLAFAEGDPTTPEVLEAAGAATAAALIAVSTYDEVNLGSCRLAGERFGIPHLIAQASDTNIAGQMMAAGVRVVQPQLATVLALEGALHFPAAFDILSDHADGVEIREIAMNNPGLEGRPLRRVRLAGDALVLGLRRNSEVLVPNGNTKLQQGDLLMLIGHQDSLQRALMQLNPYG
jgi:Kef-type K+ transport system membrane component KefB/Trk K+ transport system NAD-binding subunit